MSDKVKIKLTDNTTENQLKLEVVINKDDLMTVDMPLNELVRMQEAINKGDGLKLLRTLTSIVEKLESKTEGGINGTSQIIE